MGDKDDYGNLLSDSLNKVSTNSNSLFSDNQTALTGLTSGNNESVFDQNTVIDLAGQKNLGNNSDFDAFNNPAGDTSQNYAQPNPYTVDASGKISGLTSLNDIKKFISDNKGLLGLAAAGAGAMSPGAQYGKTGYQGSIPLLSATRNMITKPPTRAEGYRPGAGGINYGGDVTYSRLPAGTDSWANLKGDSGSAAGANLTPVTTPTSGISKLPIKYNEVKKTQTPTISSQQITDWLKQNPGASDITIANAMKQYGVTPQQMATATGLSLKEVDDRFNMASGINDWLAANKGASDISIGNAMDQFKVTPEQMARATGLSLKDVQDRYNRSNDIENWLDTNKGASDVDIRRAMDQFKVTPEQMALATGVSLNDVQSRYDAAIPPAEERSGESSPAAPVSIADIQNWLSQNQGSSDKEIAAAMSQYDVTPAQMAAATGLSEQEIISRQRAVGYAMGGMAKGRYLQGKTDGMADEIPARIGRNQPAALSHGEFVIPADVVSHMGNGNSDAGAKKLYQMMDKIRMARTGNKKQGKKINPDKFMPGGLAAAYAAGGAVKSFQTGGSTGTPAANVNAGIAGVESNLSNWAGDYTTNMLGQGQALANMPYQQYMGPLTAGESTLQNKVSSGLNSLSFPGNLGKSFSSSSAYTPAQMTMGQEQPLGTNGDVSAGAGTAQPTGIASQYMNPYLQSVLNPQLEELRRQSQINLQPSLAKLTQAGGFGGGRQAIMESEANRNLLSAQNQAIGTGYANAYDKGMQQFNTEQGQSNTLANMMAQQGATQRGIESEGIAADKAQFEEARANPYKMVQFQQSLLQGLPLDAKSYQGIEQSDIVKAAQGATTVNQLLKNLGLIT